MKLRAMVVTRAAAISHLSIWTDTFGNAVIIVRFTGKDGTAAGELSVNVVVA